MSGASNRLAACLAAGKRSAAGQAAASLVETLEEGRDGLVTRPVCATGGTFGGLSTHPVCLTGETFDDSAPFFIDWLTVSQDHPQGGLPVVEAGAVWCVDEQGEVEWKTTKAVKHQGSWETSLAVKSDGFRVTLAGNVGRFGRSDNVFGFGLVECLRRANEVLAHYGLPPFTVGKQWHRITKGRVVSSWTGARISRIDLTANYEAGSHDEALAVLTYLASQHKGKQRGRTVPQGTTVDWGRGSRRQYWKAYIKATELQHHTPDRVELINHCQAVGLVRFEGTVRSNALTDLGCAYLGDYERGWAMPQLIRLFNESTEILSRAERVTDDLEQLPRPLRATARDYLAGMDVRNVLSRRTFYRHRKELLPFGIDLAVANVTPFKPRVQVVQLRPAQKPDWYQLAA